MVDLDKAKNFLRVEHDEDDTLIEMYIDAAAGYIKSACGDNVDLNKKKVETVQLMLISDYYENRAATGQGGYSHSVSSMLTQLRLETEIEGENSGYSEDEA